jgi:hypothetical protein
VDDVVAPRRDEALSMAKPKILSKVGPRREVACKWQQVPFHGETRTLLVVPAAEIKEKAKNYWAERHTVFIHNTMAKSKCVAHTD